LDERKTHHYPKNELLVRNDAKYLEVKSLSAAARIERGIRQQANMTAPSVI
jgi:hypothetical protein